jgi:hypothetical protein
MPLIWPPDAQFSGTPCSAISKTKGDTGMTANKAVSFAEVGYTIKERHLALESIRLSWGYTGYAAHCDL